MNKTTLLSKDRDKILKLSKKYKSFDVKYLKNEMIKVIVDKSFNLGNTD